MGARAAFTINCSPLSSPCKTSVLHDMLERLDPPCASPGFFSLCMAAICQFSWKLEACGVTIYSNSAGYFWGRKAFSLYLSLPLKPKCGSELDPDEPRAKANNQIFSISKHVHICIVPWSVLSPFAKESPPESCHLHNLIPPLKVPPT